MGGWLVGSWFGGWVGGWVGGWFGGWVRGWVGGLMPHENHVIMKAQSILAISRFVAARKKVWEDLFFINASRKPYKNVGPEHVCYKPVFRRS